jgi:thiosulfate/3-mercaptopyruvate sulfurtransferase
MNKKIGGLSIVLFITLAGTGVHIALAGAAARARTGAGTGAVVGANAAPRQMDQPDQTDPWTPEQLMEPEILAARLKDIQANPSLIICVGPSGLIKGSVETGPAHVPANLDSLKTLLAREDRQREVVIYCGCCPFKNCPNVRPAFSLLLSMGFKKPRLLDLSHNIKVDWIDKGYPVTTR